MSYYTIEANYGGDTHSLSFYSDGFQHELDDYVTSIAQVRAALAHHFSLANNTFNLQSISVNGNMVVFHQDSELEAALQELDHGDSLAVNVVATGSKKKNKKQQLYVFDTDTDSDSDTTTTASSSSSDDDLNLTDYDSPYEWDEAPRKAEDKKKKYNNNRISAIIRRFKPHKQDWNDNVPKSPLYKEFGFPIRPQVAQLQYLLTLTGDMHLSHTSEQVGSYQSYTEKALQKLRERHGIAATGIENYDKKTMKALEKDVLKMRSEGIPWV